MAQHEPQVHSARQLAGDWRHQHLREPGDDDGLADLQAVEAPNLREKEGYQIGRPVKAGADHESVERAEREVAIGKGAQIDDRLMVGQHAPEEQDGGDARDDHGGEDRAVRKPIPARAFLKRVLEAAEKQRHQHQTGQIEMTQQRHLGLVDVDQDPYGAGDGDAGHDIYEEQPMPGKGIGQITADRRAQRRREVQDQPDQHHDLRQLRHSEFRIDDGKHQRHHRAAAEPLQRAIDNHLAEAGCGGAQRARPGEAERRDHEQHAGRQQPRQSAGQRHHHDVGNQVGGLDPADLVGACRQPALDLRQRAGHDLDVHDRHEEADDHREDAKPVAQAGGCSQILRACPSTPAAPPPP